MNSICYISYRESFSIMGGGALVGITRNCELTDGLPGPNAVNYAANELHRIALCT